MKSWPLASSSSSSSSSLSLLLLFLSNFFSTVWCAQEPDRDDVATFYTSQEDQMLDACSAEYNTYINKTVFQLYGVLEDETHHPSKCLFFCVPKKLSITDDTGVIDTVQIKDLLSSRYPKLSDSIIKAVVKKCTRRLDGDACDRWYRLTKCIWNTYLNSKKGRRSHHDRRSKLSARKEHGEDSTRAE